MPNDQCLFEKIYWKNIKDKVEKINPTLYRIICEIPCENKSFIKVTYDYGDLIIKNGDICLPLKKGGFISIEDRNFPTELRHSLGYSQVPLGLVLNNSAEVFVDAGGIIPLNVMKEGDIFGVFELVQALNEQENEPAFWNVSSGITSTFLLPSISDSVSHSRIKKEFSIKLDPPRKLSNHQALFKEIYKKSAKDISWKSEILFFTNEWFFAEKLEREPKLESYIFSLYYQQLQVFRDTMELKIAFSPFNLEISKRNLKPNNYIMETVKYLVSIAYGGFLCFLPAMDEKLIPLNLLRSVYLDIYRLASYCPVFMVPSHLTSGETGYYSMNYPVLLDSPSGRHDRRSIITEQKLLKKMIDILKKVAKENKQLHKFRETEYLFFHSDGSLNGDILTSKKIAELDLRLIGSDVKTDKKELCFNSPFFKGCVSINKRERDDS